MSSVVRPPVAIPETRVHDRAFARVLVVGLCVHESCPPLRLRAPKRARNGNIARACGAFTGRAAIRSNRIAWPLPISLAYRHDHLAPVALFVVARAATGISAAPPRTAPSPSRRCPCKSANWNANSAPSWSSGGRARSCSPISVSTSRERADRILAATRDLVDFARHRDVLTGPLRLGIIPTLAPYVLPRVLPRLQKDYPGLRLEVRETQTKLLLEELDRRRARLRDAGAAGGRRRRGNA